MRRAAGMFDVSHMGEIETCGPAGGGVPAADPLQRRDQAGRAAAPSTRCSAARTAACSTTSSPTGSRAGPLPDGHERRQPREGPRLVRAARRGLRRRGARRRTPTGRCSPSRARGRAPRSRRSPPASCPRACATADLALAGAPALVCGTGYTGEDGCELMLAARRRRRRLGRAARAGRDARRARRARHAAARGLLPPLRQRPVRGPQPDRGRARLVLQARHGLHRRGRAARPCEPERKLVPFAFTGPGIPRQGNPVRAHRRTRGSSRAARMSPCLELGIGMAYVPLSRRRTGYSRSRWTCAASCAPPRCASKPLYKRKESSG